MMQPLLIYPDFSKPFTLTTDASGYAIGAILSQKVDGHSMPIAYASQQLKKAEQNYSTVERECLAIVWATKYFRCYLYGRKFTIVTDHRPLKWLMNVKDPASRLARWNLKLQDYDFEIVHKPGLQQTHVDCLSRLVMSVRKGEGVEKFPRPLLTRYTIKEAQREDSKLGKIIDEIEEGGQDRTPFFLDEDGLLY